MTFLGIRLQQPLDVVWVSLKTGDAVRGILIDRTRDLMVLRSAQLGTERPSDHAQIWTRLQGDVVVPMDNVDYWQRGLPADVLEG